MHDRSDVLFKRMMERENEPAMKKRQLSLSLKGNCFAVVLNNTFQLSEKELFLLVLLIVSSRHLMILSHDGLR